MVYTYTPHFLTTPAALVSAFACFSLTVYMTQTATLLFVSQCLILVAFQLVGAVLSLDFC